MTDLSGRIADLTDTRQRLLARLRQERASQIGSIPAGTVPEGRPAPLSFAQRRLWFMHQLGGGHVAYSAPVIHRIRGGLDVDRLAESLRLLLHRHPALRTAFPEHDGEPVQVVRDVPEPVLRRHSVASLPPGDRDDAAQHLVRAEVQTPFDLAAGPVVRTTVIEVADDDHILVLNIHHISSDQWSMGVLVRELAECYAALSDGRRPQLADLPVSYADFAAWQRDRMSAAVLSERLTYWRDKLSGLSEVDLPADRPRPPVPSHRGAETAMWLPPEVIAAVREAGAAAGVSPFMTLLAAFTGLLARYAGTPDVAVGTTAAGRDSDELAGLIGFFVNTLVLRVDTSDDPTFGQLLDRVRTTVLDGHRYADLPFDLLVEHLRPAREASRPPLVSIMFQQDNTPDCALRLHGTDVELVDDFDPGTAKYDLLVSVRVWPNTARVHAQYNADLFDRATVDQLLSAYRNLLEAATGDVNARLSVLPLLTEQERHRVLVEWNDTATQLTDDVCLHEFFAATAASNPDAPAAVAGATTLSLAELDARANHVAHRLAELGVRPGVLVAVHLPPGVDHLIAVLATLKAGAAFVPVDPGYPRSRIEFILGDSAAAVVITTAELARGLPAHVTVVRVQDEHGSAPTAPDSGVTPDDPCYVIYTSGSTGTPKGVVLRHRGVVNNLADLNDRFSVGPGDSVLALSSPSFDMSVYELLGVPSAGGTVVFPEPELVRDPAHWAELIADHGVTVWNSAPALLDLLLDHVEQSVDEPLGSLRLALVGGDWIALGMPERLRALAPRAAFVSLGGATEVSVHSTIHPVPAVDPQWTSIPYGRPLANQHAYVLDAHDQPVPVGVPGELHLGGAGVAIGYLDRPELTAAKFADLFGDRVYRTGDMARWRPDGVLELLGRKDFMVKVNGLRLELGEVEAALRAHPAIDAAVAVVRTDDDGDRQLVAYARGHAAAADLRASLVARLPGYMVPHQVVVVDEFPTTPNGKIDRRSLADRRPQPGGGQGEPPAGPVEEQIAAVWRTVLGVDRVDRHDDFFARGGDSFKAVRAARLVDSDLPVIAIFRNPTIAGLAEHLARAKIGGDAPLLHRLTDARGSADATLVCLPYGGGNPVAYQPLADALADRVELWAVDLPGHDLADTRPLADIDEVARQCAEQIKARVSGPVAVYGQCAGTAATLVLARRLEEIGVEVTATFLGAALPDKDPERSWRMLTEGTDEQLLDHMRRLGGFGGALTDQDIDGIMRVVRHDLTQMVGLYRAEAGQPVHRLAGPVHCLVGDEDPATEGFQDRFRDWGRYGTGVTLSVVPGGHYFCKDQPRAVAEVVTDRLLPPVAAAA